jgi:hypothetical protein
MHSEIKVDILVKTCRLFQAPALHILRWTYNCRRDRQHYHFSNITAGNPSIPHDWFPALQRVEIHLRYTAAQCVWNCSVLKNAFEGHDDLDFMFSVPTADGPMPSVKDVM